MKYFREKQQIGLGLVEVVIAVGIIASVIAALVGGLSVFLRAVFTNTASVQAIYLAEEGLEAVRLMRDDGWSENVAPLLVETNYFLTFTDGIWTADTATTTINSEFQRYFVLEQVRRDSEDNIADSGSIDSNTYKVIVNVLWLQGSERVGRSITGYITNLFDE